VWTSDCGVCLLLRSGALLQHIGRLLDPGELQDFTQTGGMPCHDDHVRDKVAKEVEEAKDLDKKAELGPPEDDEQDACGLGFRVQGSGFRV
jgi:hypothetical protein